MLSEDSGYAPTNTEVSSGERTRSSSEFSVASNAEGAGALEQLRYTGQFSRARLLGFLLMHFAAFGTEVGVIGFFGWTCIVYGTSDAHHATGGDWWFFLGVSGSFLFSGAFSACAAWTCEAPAWAPRLMPLKKHCWPVAVLLTIPLGFGQLLIPLLALEDYSSRQPGAVLSSSGTNSVTNKFSCKAVNGLFEGLATGSIVVYAYWTIAMGFTATRFAGEDMCMAAAGVVLLMSSGLGLLELDYSVSRSVSGHMRRSYLYEVAHGVFRTSEVVIKVVLIVWFMASVRRDFPVWFCVPAVIDWAVTFLLVSMYSGAEYTVAVRLLCSVPCVFANLFLFIDSPYKVRAARRLSIGLTIKNGVVMVALPALVSVQYFLHGGHKINDAWKQHLYVDIGTLIIVPVYWYLFWFLCCRRPKNRHNTVFHKTDIYSCCCNGDLASLRDVVRILTYSSAVGLDFNVVDPDGYTPLMLAARNGHTEVCRLLLDEGADVNASVLGDYRPGCLSLLWTSWEARKRWTAVHMAAHRGHAEVLDWLLSGPPGGPLQDVCGETPLHVAVRHGHAAAAAVIARRRPQWRDQENMEGQKPAMLARSEEVRQAILNPSSHVDSLPATPRTFMRRFFRGRRAAGEQLLPRAAQPAAGPPGAACAARSCSGYARPPDAAWQPVQMHINRMPTEESWIAPGLCSYIASSCGGVLGRVFLTHGPTQQPRLAAGGCSEHSLSVISERSEFSSSVLEPAAAQDADAEAGQGLGAWYRRSFGQDPVLEDFLPIDRQGDVCETWLMLVRDQPIHTGQRRIFATEQSYAVRRFYNVPFEAELGRGAYGVVWRAQHRLSKDRFAIKVTNNRGDENVNTREYQVADRIRHIPHPCLVRLHCAHRCADVGLYLLVMELCPGGDVFSHVKQIRDECKRESRQYRPPAMAMAWIPQVFLGLEHMHLRMDTLLRDLKPQNIVVDERGNAKLTDFGFGRFGAAARGGWSFGFPTGSPGFVAPEILLRREHDCRADLYSLGVLVWLLLTGGLTHLEVPCPPIVRRKPGEGFDAHARDCKLLARCVADPAHNMSNPLPSDARDFVQRLISDQPSGRMCHEGIRAHRFVQRFNLPQYSDPPAVVEAWVLAAAEASAPRRAGR